MSNKKFELEDSISTKAVLNAMIDGVAITDADFKILETNREAQEMFGYEEDEMVGEPIFNYLSGMGSEESKSSLSKIITEDYTGSSEFKGIKKNGDVFPISIKGAPLRDKGEDIVKCIISIKDNTELVEADEEIENLVYTVSHDLRNPLVSITGFSDVLRDEYRDVLGSEGEHYLDRIEASVERISNFIDDLLLLSRIGRKKVTEGEVKLENLIDKIKDDLSDKIEEVGAEIEIEGELPVFYFEKKRLRQLVSNLISNAIKFMGGQDNSKVRIGVEDEESSWLLWVEDNGIGIKPENQAEIFDIFFQEQRIDGEGTGVGLSVAKRIVEDYNGKIWVESEKGKGSTFYVKFPKEEVQK